MKPKQGRKERINNCVIYKIKFANAKSAWEINYKICCVIILVDKARKIHLIFYDYSSKNTHIQSNWYMLYILHIHTEFDC